MKQLHEKTISMVQNEAICQDVASSVINDLPDCILLRIFKHCNSNKVDIWRARIVCKRWYVLLADSELWRVCNLSKFKLDNCEILREMINYAPLFDLQFLEVWNSAITTDVLRMLLQNANEMHGLRLNGCTVRNGEHGMLEYKIPANLEYIDVRKSRGNFTFLEATLVCNGINIKFLGLSTNFGALTKVQNASFAALLPNLSMLECHDCMWMNDHAILDISNYCQQLVSLNITQCPNVNGSSLQHLVTRCKELRTLILCKTSIRTEHILNASWSDTKITELDMSHCYYLDDEAVSKVVVELATQLEYLRCAVTDQLISEIMHKKLKLKTLEIRRRHPVNIDNIVKMLTNCEYMESLDVSLTPIDLDLLAELLPHLSNLKWLSFAGHEILQTSEALKLISTNCTYIESIGVNYYYANEDKQLHDGLLDFILSSPNLKGICVEGAYIQTIITEIKDTLNEKDISTIEFYKPATFNLPQPKFCLNTQAANFSKINMQTDTL